MQLASVPKLLTCSARKALPSPLRSYWLCAPPKPSRRLCSRLYDESLQVTASPLLGVGGSRRYLHNPCIGAWSHTPPRLLSASTRFFLRNIGLTIEVSRSAREIYSMLCNFA